MEFLQSLPEELRGFLTSPWALDVALLLGATVLAYPLAAWVAGRLRAAAEKDSSREVGILRDLLAVCIWPTLAMALLVLGYRIWDWLEPTGAPRVSQVLPVLGFFMLYRVLSELLRDFLPPGERRRRLRRGVMPTILVLAALQQVGLLGPLIRFLQQPILELAGVSVSLFSILSALFLVLAFIFGGRLLAGVLGHKVLPGMGVDRAVSEAIATVVRYLLVVFGLMVGLTWIGFDLTTVQIAFGALGVGIGFGLQNIVNNLISGLILLFERSVKRGDILNAQGVDGRVTSVGLRASVLRTRQGDDIIVPNSLLVSERVTNYSFGDRLRRIDLDVGVSYSSRPPRIKEILLEVAKSHDAALKHPAPSVLFVAFGESSLDFQLRVWVDNAWRLPEVASDLRFAVWEAFREHGVEIPFPQRDLHLKSGFSPADRTDILD